MLVGSISDDGGALLPYEAPIITGFKPELRSKGLDRLRCCWHVQYQFCGLSGGDHRICRE